MNLSAVVSQLETKWKCEALRLGNGFALDWIMVRDVRKAVALAEIVVIHDDWNAVKSVPVSKAKWQGAKDFHALSELPFILVASANGQTRFCKITTFENENIQWGPTGVDPHFLITVERFRPL